MLYHQVSLGYDLFISLTPLSITYAMHAGRLWQYPTVFGPTFHRLWGTRTAEFESVISSIGGQTKICADCPFDQELLFL